MNRRSFFATLAALFVAPKVLPRPTVQEGIKMRAVSYRDGDHTYYRIDVLYGAFPIKSEYSCRVVG